MAINKAILLPDVSEIYYKGFSSTSFFLYSFLLNLLGFGLSMRLLIIWMDVGVIPPINALAVFFSFIVGIQMLLFAMWFDMDSNKHLR